MARKRRPVRCRNCGYVTTPVSGFCPNCLELLPLGGRVALVPIIVIAGLVALAAAVLAASSTGGLALRPPTVIQIASPSAPLSPTPTASSNGSASSSAAASRTSSPSLAPAVLGSQSPPVVSGNLPSTATSSRTGTGGKRY